MRGKDLLDKMELVDPAYVEEADIIPGKKKRPWIQWGIVAACMVGLMFAGGKLLLQNQSAVNENLPILSISENILGMGFEGYMAYDISELVNANPWNEEMEIATLPVYENTLSYDENAILTGADYDQIEETLWDIAERMGLDTNVLTITDNVPDEQIQQEIIEKFQSMGDTVPDGYFAPTKWMIEAEEIKITVDQTLTAEITFDPPLSLPENYNFSPNATYEELTAVADYFKNTYQTWIDMDDPQINIYGGYYDINQQRDYSIGFFNGAENVADQIINYNFYRMVFYGNEDGELYLIRIYQSDLSKKLGDYPIIGAEKAKELLLNGHYITTVPYAISQPEAIQKVELIYRSGQQETYYMPYYRFYVELPEKENGLNKYGAYYVPAVEGSYLSDLPTWDGRFN